MYKQVGKRGRIYSIILLFLLVLCCGCRGKTGVVLSTALSPVPGISGQGEALPECNTPYTVGYPNRDGTYSLYIFSSPVQYPTGDGYAVIDNTVVASGKEGFAYENKANEIKAYFPPSLSEYFRVEKGEAWIEFKPCGDWSGFSEAKDTPYVNMYGDTVSAVLYEGTALDMVFYPTKAGIQAELVLKKCPEENTLDFCVRTNDASYIDRQNGYIVFRDGDDIQSVVRQPLLRHHPDKAFDVTTDVSILYKADGQHVQLLMDEAVLRGAVYPVKLDPSFEIYTEKIPDSSVYSEFDTNAYLRHYEVVGHHPALGEGWTYVRFRLNTYFHAAPADILSAEYCVRELYTSGAVKTAFYKPLYQWNSQSVVWSDRVPEDKRVSAKSRTQASVRAYDIMEFVRDCVEFYSWETELMGLLLKAEEDEGFRIFASSDHALYSPYVVVRLKTRPESLERTEAGSPDGGF